jgi:hypothetical protein
MKKRIYSTLAGLAVGGACYALIGWDLGADISPLAKFFLIFFGVIVVLQIIPAAVLFVCMIKEMLIRSGRPDKQSLLVERQGEHRAQ